MEARMMYHSAKYVYRPLIQFNMKDVQNLNSGKVKEEGGDPGHEKHYKEWF